MTDLIATFEAAAAQTEKPVDPNADVDSLEPGELEQIRRAIMTKYGDNYKDMTDDDLARLYRVTSVLRRRTSGPPKDARKSATATRVKPKSTDELLSGF